MKKLFLSLLVVLSVGLSFSPTNVSANTREARVLSSQEREATYPIDPLGSVTWSPYFNQVYTSLWVTNGYTRTGTTTTSRFVGLLTERYTYR